LVGGGRGHDEVILQSILICSLELLWYRSALTRGLPQRATTTTAAGHLSHRRKLIVVELVKCSSAVTNLDASERCGAERDADDIRVVYDMVRYSGPHLFVFFSQLLHTTYILECTY
jgi:hypothetical protein